jgi:hypothetical protein
MDDSQSTPSEPNSIRHLLVAYLDGELDVESRRALEDRLESEPELKNLLDELRATWDLLDKLETPEPTSTFTESTLQQVAINAEQSPDVGRFGSVPSRSIRRLFYLLFFAFVTFLGFALVHFWQTAPRRALVANLPILAHFDILRLVGSMDYLELLDRSGLFAETEKNRDKIVQQPVGELPIELLVPISKVEISWLHRFNRLRTISPNQSAILWERLRGWEQLPKDERDRMIGLSQKLAASADRDRLVRLARRYTVWLESQSTYTRFELAELKPATRVKSVGEICREQQDQAGLERWLRAMAKRFQPEEFERLSSRGEISKDDRPLSLEQFEMTRLLAKQFYNRFGTNEPDAQAGKLLALLRNELSSETADSLAQMSIKEQSKWVMQNIRSMIEETGRDRMLQGADVKIDDEDLAKFFKTLPESQRDLLLKMPGDQMYETLRRFYQFDRRRGPFPPPGGPGMGGRGGRGQGQGPRRGFGDRPPGGGRGAIPREREPIDRKPN